MKINMIFFNQIFKTKSQDKLLRIFVKYLTIVNQINFKKHVECNVESLPAVRIIFNDF